MNPLSNEQLCALLEDLESDRVERKQSFKGDVPTSARQAVCAFANDLPGYNAPSVLFVGVKDNGESAGLEITDDLLRALADMKTDGNILPLPMLTVEKRRLKGMDVAVVTVHPSDNPPVKYKGRIWIRTGPRRAIANAQEERILTEKRRYKNLPFDIYPVPTAKVEDLSRVIFESEYLPQAFAPDILEENHRSYLERLASTRMIVSVDDPTPTVLGLLTLGKSPQDFIPGAAIQFLRIDGTELADPVIDEEHIGGTLAQSLQRTTDKLRAHLHTSMDVISGPTHRATTPYPLAALHQILYNAVLHRTYENTNTFVRVYWFSDRIEIHSPGGPYGNVTVDNFGQPGITDYRNPNLAAALKTFGFIQQFGRGIAIAQREMHNNGNPPPEFIATASAVVCILRETL